jgi:UDP-GlcNAc:undecaprenyl-phosphate GlcNAc-1-phosphate transferase
MAQLALIVVSAALVSVAAAPLLRRLAPTLEFMDKPDERKVHVSPVPLLGGVAIYTGVVAAVVVTNNVQPYLKELGGVLLGATLVTGLGLWDDRYGMKPLIKLAGLVLAGLVLILVADIQVTLLRPNWLNIGVTLFWLLGIANAINFLDNMDGLAAGLTSVAAGFFLILAVLEGLSLVSALAAATLGASLGFLYHNFQPASLFMGDAGSLLLGYILAVLGMKLEFPNRPLASTWLIPIIVLALPVFDTTLVVISRLRRGHPVYLGGKDHISHRLVSRFGMSPERAVLTLYYCAIALGLIALIVREALPWQAWSIGGALMAVFLAGLILFEHGYKLER